MTRQIKIQTKITGRLILIHVLLSLFPACINSSSKSEKDSRNEKNPKNKIETIEKATSQVAVSVIAEQDPNGIFWGLRDTATGKLVLGYTFEKIWNFKNGFATVLLNGKYGLINKYGKVVVEPNYDSPEKMDVKCGCVAFEVGYGPIVIIDTNGKSVVPMTSGITGILPCQKRITMGDDKFGMINFNNDTILPFKFREAHLLPEGFCVASKFDSSPDDNLYGLYDLNGKQVLPHAFEMIDGFYCGRALVKKKGKYGVIDETGKELFYTDYGRIDRFTNGYALIYTNPKDGEIKVGVINKNGKVVVPAIYQWLENVYNFSDGLAAMAQNRKYGFVDTTGRIVVQFNYDKVESFRNNIAKVWVGWQHVGYINNNGKEIISPNFEALDQANLRRYYDKFIIGLKDSLQHVFDYSGKEIVVLNYKTINEFNKNEKSFIVSINNKFGVLDSNFRIKIPIKYESLEMIFPDKIAAREQGKIGFINQAGKLLYSFGYDSINPIQDDNVNAYENGLAEVGIKGKKGLINSYGKVIIPVIYDKIESFSHSLAVVKRNGKYGFVNFRGKEVIPAIYNKADSYDGYSAKVTLKGKAFQVNSSGKRVEEDTD
ncbi:WG repeat-containing protein [Mucilaginibacter sp. L196]|uniref:WG repeat-containing protein n=1 Tax=Mucilaginibacter sp. L196 TaxID=1641870 RepID=UPI00131E42E0|nr:WG repeat-containing protein [Mucilaginibacter sp. L196]